MTANRYFMIGFFLPILHVLEKERGHCVEVTLRDTVSEQNWMCCSLMTIYNLAKMITENQRSFRLNSTNLTRKRFVSFYSLDTCL